MIKKGSAAIIIAVIIVALLIVGGVYYYGAYRAPEGTAAPAGTSTAAAGGQTASSTSQASTIEYRDTLYGFTVSLPASWAGYTLVTSTWQGYSTSGAQQPIYQGPILSIRNPLWTKGNPYQDIPIMIFTTKEWGAVNSESVAVSAAPFPPSELGQNSHYVFALPARYNYAYPAGYEEVQTIIDGNPLHGFN